MFPCLHNALQRFVNHIRINRITKGIHVYILELCGLVSKVSKAVICMAAELVSIETVMCLIMNWDHAVVTHANKYVIPVSTSLFLVICKLCLIQEFTDYITKAGYCIHVAFPAYTWQSL